MCGSDDDSLIELCYITSKVRHDKTVALKSAIKFNKFCLVIQITLVGWLTGSDKQRISNFMS